MRIAEESIRKIVETAGKDGNSSKIREAITGLTKLKELIEKNIEYLRKLLE